MTSLDDLEARLSRLETIVDKGTPAGQYTAVVEKLMADNGWTAEEACTNFNNLLASIKS